jgi:hypothetical protein
VTGREILKEIAGDEAVESLYARGFVCVPRVATKKMQEDAYDAAPGENLGWIWDALIDASESATEPVVSGNLDRKD